MKEVVQNDTSYVAELYPEAYEFGVPTSASVKAYSPSGDLLATITGSVDGVDTTISSATSDQQSLTVGSASGIVVGRKYLVSASSGAIATVVAEAIDGSVVQISEPTGFDPTGSTLKGIRVSVTLSADATKERSVNHSLIWEIAHSSGSRVYSDVYHVVRTQFRDPVAPSDVYSFIASHHPSSAASMTMERRKAIADRANARVRARLLETQRYPHLVGDPSTFIEAGRASLEWVLLSERMLLPASDEDLSMALKELDRRVAEEVSRGISNCWYDADDDRKVERDEIAPISVRIEL